MFTIRPFDFSDQDYAATVALWNAAHPEHPSSVHYQKREDELFHSEPEWALYRALAVLDESTREPGRCVGSGHFMHRPWSYHLHKLALFIVVHPGFEAAGIADALYDHLWERSLPYEPITFESGAFENDTHAVHFLERHGFRAVQRGQDSELDTAGFDPQPYAGLLARVAADGIRIRGLREWLAAEPDFLERFYTLQGTLERDVPYYDDVITPPPYTEWVKAFQPDNPDLLPDMILFAQDGDTLVGMTELWAGQATDQLLYTGFTGVMRSHRRRAIATALKVRALSLARQRLTSTGIPPRVRTGNEENNPMLQINLRLGFVELPAWVIYVKELASDSDGDG